MYYSGIKYISAFLFCAFIVPGCSSPFKGSGPYKPCDKAIKSGQRYYVGKNVLFVSADITNKIVPAVDNNLNILKIIYTTTTAKFSKKLVPDYRQYYMVHINAGSIYDDKIKVETTSDGLLTSLSSEVTGKTGQIIKDIGTISSNLLAIAPFIMAETARKGKCVKYAKELGLNNEHQLFSFENKNGCSILKRLIDLKKTTEKFQGSIDTLREEIAVTDDNEILKELKNRLDIKEAELNRTIAEVNENNKIYEAIFSLFKQNRLAIKEMKWTLNQTFELDELPADSDINGLIGKNESDVIKILKEKRYTKMAYLFANAKVLITRESFAPLAAGYFSDVLPSIPENEKMPTNRVHFRQSYPFHIGEYHLKHVFDKKSPTVLFKKSNSIISFMHPHSPIQFVEYKSSIFSQRKLELTFDVETNSLITIETDNKSSIAAATSSFSETIVAMRKEYLNALNTIESTQKMLTSIELNDYEKKIEELKKKKELIDAQVAFEGAAATQELLLEQNLLDQKLNVLKSDLALKQAELTYGQKLGIEKVSADLKLLSNQLEFAKKEITYQQQLEIEKLRSDILVLQEKIKLIEHESKLKP